jgi:predicted transcriptional regulator
LEEALANAPYDDEPLTDEDIAAIKEGAADVKAGRVMTTDELRRSLGLPPLN